MKPISKLFISALLLLLFTSPVKAAEGPFNKDPTVEGPATHYFEDYKDDPTYKLCLVQPTHQQCKNIINNAYVVGFPPSKFIPGFEGDTAYLPKGSLWDKKKDLAYIDLGLVDWFSNTTLQNEIVLKKGKDAVPSKIRMNTSPADTYGNPFSENCFWSNGGNKEECLRDHDALFENGTTNIFAISTPAQRLTPLSVQYKLREEQAKEDLQCASLNPPENIECDNWYWMRGGVKSKDAARSTLETSYKSYLKNPEKYPEIFSQKVGDGGLIPFAYVVTKLKDKGVDEPRGILGFLFKYIDIFLQIDPGKDIPVVAIGWIPSIRGSSRNAKVLRDTTLPLELQKDNDAEVSALLNRPIDWTGVDNIKKAFIKKAKQTPHVVATEKALQKLQFTGATVKTQPDPVFQIIPEFNLEDYDDFTEASKKPVEFYEIKVVLPPYIVEKEQYLKALSQTLFTQRLVDYPDTYQEILLAKSKELPKVFEKDVVDIVPIPCKDDPKKTCYKEITEEVASISWKYNLNPAGIAPESETETRVFSANQLGLPRNHEGYFESTCLFNELSARIPGLADIIGTEVGLFNTSSCPEQIRETPSSSSFSENICGIAKNYNIPCCQLEGIMEVETGRGTGCSSSGCDSCKTSKKTFKCCNGSVCGPAQIACGQYDMFDGGDGLDMCSESGAAELLARAMLSKKCQAAGECYYDWEKFGDMLLKKYSIADGEYDPAAYFYGLSRGCVTNACSEYRWGPGKGYCDSIKSYCNKEGILPGNTHMEYCEECNIEIERAGQEPIVCK